MPQRCILDADSVSPTWNEQAHTDARHQLDRLQTTARGLQSRWPNPAHCGSLSRILKVQGHEWVVPKQTSAILLFSLSDFLRDLSLFPPCLSPLSVSAFPVHFHALAGSRKGKGQLQPSWTLHHQGAECAPAPRCPLQGKGKLWTCDIFPQLGRGLSVAYGWFPDSQGGAVARYLRHIFLQTFYFTRFSYIPWKSLQPLWEIGRLLG